MGRSTRPSRWASNAFDRMTATFDLTGVAEGDYDVRVTLPGGGSDTLPAAFHVAAGRRGEAGDPAHPARATSGRHAVGDDLRRVRQHRHGGHAGPDPDPAIGRPRRQRPALADARPSRLTTGFLDLEASPTGSATRSRSTPAERRPGLLQPGESIRVPVYYAGLQQPWDFSDTLWSSRSSIHDAGDTSSVDWDSLKTDLQPSWIPDGAWDPIFANLTAQIGPTWGDYVQMLSDNASYLGRLGLRVTDVDQLYGFELQQAIGLNPVLDPRRGGRCLAADPGPLARLRPVVRQHHPRAVPGRTARLRVVNAVGRDSTIEEIVDPVRLSAASVRWQVPAGHPFESREGASRRSSRRTAATRTVSSSASPATRETCDWSVIGPTRPTRRISRQKSTS